MDIKINSLGCFIGEEYGIDQHKNLYTRNPSQTTWTCIFEYRRPVKIRKSSCDDMRLIAEIGLFWFAVDSDSKFWKKFKQYPWTEFTNNKPAAKYSMPKIIATQNINYWRKERKNGTIIKRSCKRINRPYKRQKEFDDLVLAKKREKQAKKKKANKANK